MRFEFAITYETRGVFIAGTATVVGDYDGPSKPEAMVRSALAGKLHPDLKVTWLNPPTEK